MMSNSGRQQRGRGGHSAPSSGRHSSVSSSHRTTPSPRGNSSASPLPVQYNFIPNERFRQNLEPPQQYQMETEQPHVSSPPNHEPEHQMTLDDLLNIPGRDEYLPILNPFPSENTLWFDRDGGMLTKKISKILKNTFDGPYYSWTKTPPKRRDQYFIEFAQSFHWDPMITDLVREQFNHACRNRMKGMVSAAKTKGERPGWIAENLWRTMQEYWAQAEVKEKSANASLSRNSDREGLGPHKHISGQKSYLRIQQDLEQEMGRPVSIGEVFIKTHTKSDGTFIDQKAKQIVETYQKNVTEKLSQVDPSEVSDGTSRVPELSPSELNDIFLQSTIPDDRGREYGLGSLRPIYGSTKRRSGAGCSSSSSFVDMQQQLLAAQRQIEEQAAANARRDEELARITTEAARVTAESVRTVSEYQSRINNLEMLVGYLRSTDPGVAAFMDSHAPPPPPDSTAPDPSSSS